MMIRYDKYELVKKILMEINLSKIFWYIDVIRILST